MTKKVSPTQKMLFWWGLALICWSAYRSFFKTDLPIWFDEFIAKPIVFITPVFLYIKRVEKKKFFERVGLNFKNVFQDAVIGLLFGIVILLIGTTVTKLPFRLNIGLVILTALATSISEEILSRGFVLKRLYEEWGNIWTSSFFSSILFFFLRVPILFTNDRIVGSTLLMIMAVDIIFSLLVSFIFLNRKSLVLPILIHTFYSVFLYLSFS